jgi:uncharacterized protein YkwD
LLASTVLAISLVASSSSADTVHAGGPGTTVDGSFAGTGLLRAGTVTKVDIAGRGGIPNGATTVALNLTATQATANGFAVIYACGTPRPLASTINFQTGTTIANAIITKLGTSGDVCIYTNQNTHIIIDVNGYLTANTDYKSLNPARLLDSRPKTPEAQAEDYSLVLLNELRASRGLAELRIDLNMSVYAQRWSQEMSRSGFRHSGGPWAENIVWYSAASMTPQQAAASFHWSWVHSPAHYLSMINPSWSYVGIGLYHDASGWYGTHEFRS